MHAVVVIWGDVPAMQVEGDRVTYVAGERLADCLREQTATLSPRAQSLLTLALDAEVVAPPAVAAV